MNESKGKEVEKGPSHDQKEAKEMSPTPGYCSATCVDKPGLLEEINKPPLKTSEIYATCNLPRRYEYPHWFNGYGSQANKQHPFYRTTASEYGWYPPDIHTVPSFYFPANQRFTNQLSAAGMYRNYSLNTSMDQQGFL